VFVENRICFPVLPRLAWIKHDRDIVAFRFRQKQMSICVVTTKKSTLLSVRQQTACSVFRVASVGFENAQWENCDFRFANKTNAVDQQSACAGFKSDTCNESIVEHVFSSFNSVSQCAETEMHIVTTSA
jgi:hypothetical protein